MGCLEEAGDGQVLGGDLERAVWWLLLRLLPFQLCLKLFRLPIEMGGHSCLIRSGLIRSALLIHLSKASAI
eukprot:m.42300 g.42300  ORF g.42300 m.42300 type:complete len:71 (-) comp12093_c0_seq2:141-353(-)